MMLQLIGGRLRSLFLVLAALVNRALCCFSRKRRNSFGDCEVTLQSVAVGSGDQLQAGGGGGGGGGVSGGYGAGGVGSSGRKRGDDERDWNSWDDSPRTVDEHIEQYRQQLVQPSAAEAARSAEPAVDFFQDMTPTIIKQTKVLLRTGSADQQSPSAFARLEATTHNMLMATGPELADWSEDATGAVGGGGAASLGDGGDLGWDELDDENTTHLIREKRREQRMQRQLLQQQQKLQQQHQQRPGGTIGARVGGGGAK